MEFFFSTMKRYAKCWHLRFFLTSCTIRIEDFSFKILIALSLTMSTSTVLCMPIYFFFTNLLSSLNETVLYAFNVTYFVNNMNEVAWPQLDFNPYSTSVG